MKKPVQRVSAITEGVAQPLIAFVNGILPLTEEEVAALTQCISVKQLKRRQFLLQAGNICKEYSFVVHGCLRMYNTSNDGNEHNLQFAIENEWIADIGSFHSELPSALEIEALEPTVVLQLTKTDLINLYTEHLKFNRIFRVLVEDAYVQLQQRMLQNISSTAEERYQDFVRQHPQLFHRISNVQIASYIGITPEFLSRIRKSISMK